MGAAFQERAGLGAEHEKLSSARAGAPTGPFVDEVRRAVLMRARSGRQFHGVADDFLGDGHLAHDIMKAEHVFAGEQRFNERGRFGGGPRDHGDLLILGQVIHHDIEHEAIQLRLGQRIRAFHLNRVLRGEDEERFLQRVANSGGRDLMLLHCFEQRGLGLGRRAIDFIGEDDVGKHRSADENHSSPLAGVL